VPQWNSACVMIAFHCSLQRRSFFGENRKKIQENRAIQTSKSGFRVHLTSHHYFALLPQWYRWRTTLDDLWQYIGTNASEEECSHMGCECLASVPRPDRFERPRGRWPRSSIWISMETFWCKVCAFVIVAVAVVDQWFSFLNSAATDTATCMPITAVKE
jgi:hypothetical protein